MCIDELGKCCHASYVHVAKVHWTLNRTEERKKNVIKILQCANNGNEPSPWFVTIVAYKLVDLRSFNNFNSINSILAKWYFAWRRAFDVYVTPERMRRYLRSDFISLLQWKCNLHGIRYMIRSFEVVLAVSVDAKFWRIRCFSLWIHFWFMQNENIQCVTSSHHTPQIRSHIHIDSIEFNGIAILHVSPRHAVKRKDQAVTAK